MRPLTGPLEGDHRGHLQKELAMADLQLLDQLRGLWDRQLEPEPEHERESIDLFDVTGDGNGGEPKSPDWCRQYGHRRGWRSIYGPHLICATCHSPVSDSVIAEWIDA